LSIFSTPILREAYNTFLLHVSVGRQVFNTHLRETALNFLLLFYLLSCHFFTIRVLLCFI
jgi:hypothetical protein